MLNPSWRSSGDSPCGLGRLIPARTEFARARVCGSDEKSFGEEEVRDLGFPLGGGEHFYSHQGRRPSSGALTGTDDIPGATELLGER
jgi:hypothetical protein